MILNRAVAWSWRATLGVFKSHGAFCGDSLGGNRGMLPSLAGAQAGQAPMVAIARRRLARGIRLASHASSRRCRENLRRIRRRVYRSRPLVAPLRGRSCLDQMGRRRGCRRASRDVHHRHATDGQGLTVSPRLLRGTAWLSVRRPRGQGPDASLDNSGCSWLLRPRTFSTNTSTRCNTRSRC